MVSVRKRLLFKELRPGFAWKAGLDEPRKYELQEPPSCELSSFHASSSYPSISPVHSSRALAQPVIPPTSIILFVSVSPCPMM